MNAVTPLFRPHGTVSSPWSNHRDLDAEAGLQDLLHVVGVQTVGVDMWHSGYPLALRQVHAGATLYHEGSEAQAVYFVRSGMFRTSRISEDGYEQVLGFPRRGELLGFDAVCVGRHPSEAVALEDAAVYPVMMQDLFTMGEREPQLDRALHLAVSRQVARHADITDMMAAVSAEVRLARFLVDLADQQDISGHVPGCLQLCMSRRDIASHLGVAHETVSRAFSALGSWGYLRVENRHVELQDLTGLRNFARNTRGRTENDGTDDPHPHHAHHAPRATGTSPAELCVA